MDTSGARAWGPGAPKKRFISGARELRTCENLGALPKLRARVPEISDRHMTARGRPCPCPCRYANSVPPPRLASSATKSGYPSRFSSDGPRGPSLGPRMEVSFLGGHFRGAPRYELISRPLDLAGGKRSGASLWPQFGRLSSPQEVRGTRPSTLRRLLGASPPTLTPGPGEP